MFHIFSEDQIKNAVITDVYFERTIKIIKEKGLDKVVAAEVRARELPSDYRWAILGGIEEALTLLEGLPVNVWAMPEGTLFHAMEPVLLIEGKYSDFAAYETCLLGFLCQASGIATRAARCKLASGGKPVYHFGARRMHPGITLMIDRSSYIGGCDGVAVKESARFLEEEPVGTIPHSLVLLAGDTLKSIKLFDEVIEPQVKRVALIDTLGDEKFEALRVADELGRKLFAVRIDTPASRRGDILAILKEIRWELDLRGFNHVKLFVSGGLNEKKIRQLNQVADAFGVGTWISNAPVVDFALDIVEIDKKPIAKKGKHSGKKQVWRCPACGAGRILPWSEDIPSCECGEKMVPLLKLMIREGKLVNPFPSVKKIRDFVLSQLKKLEKSEVEDWL
ncbi:MAG TPA: nicotinate phosphoribosyltransferase [Candidatus Aerophobetes bacterium]|uniref:nicotinate phosphoribosyltransferase n=1 Tax=Aerophobetes bacterium TaxID=2030807 RepID=A0A7V5HY76_UNCAE|nr:nicotinate phosphoribosyltransferase [Candidatus Aerophobetes bacterium]